MNRTSQLTPALGGALKGAFDWLTYSRTQLKTEKDAAPAIKQGNAFISGAFEQLKVDSGQKAAASESLKLARDSAVLAARSYTAPDAQNSVVDSLIGGALHRIAETYSLLDKGYGIAGHTPTIPAVPNK